MTYNFTKKYFQSTNSSMEIDNTISTILAAHIEFTATQAEASAVLSAKTAAAQGGLGDQSTLTSNQQELSTLRSTATSLTEERDALQSAAITEAILAEQEQIYNATHSNVIGMQAEVNSTLSHSAELRTITTQLSTLSFLHRPVTTAEEIQQNIAQTTQLIDATKSTISLLREEITNIQDVQTSNKVIYQEIQDAINELTSQKVLLQQELNTLSQSGISSANLAQLLEKGIAQVKAFSQYITNISAEDGANAPAPAAVEAASNVTAPAVVEAAKSIASSLSAVVSSEAGVPLSTASSSGDSSISNDSTASSLAESLVAAQSSAESARVEEVAKAEEAVLAQQSIQASDSSTSAEISAARDEAQPSIATGDASDVNAGNNNATEWSV